MAKIESRFSEYFQDELNSMDKQAAENDKLYNEVHKAMDKNLGRLDGKMMMGSSSPYRDIAMLGDTLNDIRANQVAIIKEKANIKKTIIDLDIRKENSKSQSNDAETNQMLMRDILIRIQKEVPDITKPTNTEMSDKRGLEQLKGLDPKTLGLNSNDFTMIEKFKGK